MTSTVATELQIKEVNFNGATLLAGQDSDGQIYAGASYICNGIGFTKHQKDRQIANIQTDEVLKQGCLKFEAGVFDPNNVTIALMLDFIPLWLAKISITPTLKRENPELVEKLIAYQLKAKDVLAKAFLPEQYQNSSGLSIELMNTQLQNIENRFDSMQKSFELFQTNFTQHIDTRLNTMSNAFTYIKKLLEQNSKPLFVVDVDWKSKMFKRVDELVSQQPQKYTNSKMVLRTIYNKMNSVYGVVWDQEQKDFREAHNVSGRSQTMELISDKEQLKSLFECILNDMFIDENQKVISEKVVPSARDIIAPLIKKYNDKSKGGTVTFRKVYKNMDVNWYRKEKTYIKCHRANNPPQRIKLIEQDFTLMRKFKKTVKDMMLE